MADLTLAGVVENPPVGGAIRQLVENLPVGGGGGGCQKGSPEGGGLVEASAARWWRIWREKGTTHHPEVVMEVSAASWRDW